MKNRIWIIPATILVLIVGAWGLRWEKISITPSATFYNDRWLEQNWEKGANGNGVYDTPVFPRNVIVQNGLNIIDNDPTLSQKLNEIQLALNNEKMYLDQNAETYRQYTSSSYRVLIQQGMRPENPADAQEFVKQYNTKYMKFESLQREESTIVESAQQVARQNLSNAASKRRQLFSYGSIAIGLASLIALVTMFILAGKIRNEKQEGFQSKDGSTKAGDAE